MALFGKKNEGGVLDVIRCDEPTYLVWKWRPGDGAATRKENAIRWGSSLRVKDGEVAVFVYKQESGAVQDFIEGPFDDTLRTANFPVLSNILGMAYAGDSPFQAEVYFINLAGNIKIDKEKSTEKVDGAVAMVMALDRAMKNQNNGSVYDTRGLLVLG